MMKFILMIIVVGLQIKIPDDYWIKLKKQTFAITKDKAIIHDYKYILAVFWDHALFKNDLEDKHLKKIDHCMIGNRLNLTYDSEILIVS